MRELRGLIKAVAEGTDEPILNPIQARLKRACKLHRDDETEKIRALAREILNDWTAIIAFVTNPDLPPPTTRPSAPCVTPSSPAGSPSAPEPRKARPPTPPP